MGEEFPLDPNQVEPPQEGGAVHIPVAEHSGEPTHLGSIDHDTSAPAEESIPDSYVRNVPKAAEMAVAEDNAFNAGEEFPQNASLRTGKDYDKRVAEERAPGYNPDTAEKAKSLQELDKYNVNKRNQVLRYADAITAHYAEHGDKPTTALAALAAVHELVQGTGYREFPTGTDHDYWGNENDVKVTFNEHENVVVRSGSLGSVNGKEETFTLSLLHGASYEVTEYGDQADGFDSTVVTKTRHLQPEDVDRLKVVLAPAIETRDAQKMLYEEAQREHDEQMNAQHDQDDDRGDEQDDRYAEDDDYVSTGEIQRRAYAAMGNTEEARQAARDFPGDFM